MLAQRLALGFVVGVLALSATAPVTLAASHAPTAGSIAIHKLGSQEKPLAGVDFSLYFDDSDGVFDSMTDGFLTNGSTDTDGRLTFRDLNLGSYWVVETDVPGDYVLTDPARITLPDASGQTMVSVTIRNQKVIIATPRPTVGGAPSTSVEPVTPGLERWIPVALPSAMILIIAGIAQITLSHQRRRHER